VVFPSNPLSLLSHFLFLPLVHPVHSSISLSKKRRQMVHERVCSHQRRWRISKKSTDEIDLRRGFKEYKKQRERFGENGGFFENEEKR
jgi:hypothetical protein